MSNQNEEQKAKLLKLVQDAVQHDHELREKYQVGEKFRFIRDRLQALLSHVEEHFTTMQKEEKKTTNELSEDEMVVYIYLYNTHGLVLNTWQKLLNPAVFYEYSVNRPIYAEKTHIEAFIRSKPDKIHHGYLAIVIKRQDIFPSAATLNDALGNPLMKVKEGSLHFNRFVCLMHNDIEYVLNEEGELIKKN